MRALFGLLLLSTAINIDLLLGDNDPVMCYIGPETYNSFDLEQLLPYLKKGKEIEIRFFNFLEVEDVRLPYFAQKNYPLKEDHVDFSMYIYTAFRNSGRFPASKMVYIEVEEENSFFEPFIQRLSQCLTNNHYDVLMITER